MALTFTTGVTGFSPPVPPDVKRVWYGLITFDNSYPTGGEAITAANFGLTNIEHVQLTPTAGTRLFSWDKTNSKIQIFTALSTEAANASDQSTITVQALVVGN